MVALHGMKARADRGQLLRGSMEPLLLACLEREPAHGYRIIELIREASGGVFELAEGTVYPALRRLERDGFVTSAWISGSGYRRRRIYRLTPRGAAELATRHAEWDAFAAAVNSVFRGEAQSTVK
jgi:DNA-binding PadR family transcriptional regulator